MTVDTIAILSPGDMGHAVGRALGAAGHRVITCLAGRSRRSRELAAAGNMADVGDLDQVVCAADLVLSIVPPSAAGETAAAVAAAMGRTEARPIYADCNAISPERARRIGATLAGAGAPFIDCGIIGRGPGHGPAPRFYVSGADVAAMVALDGKGIAVKPLGPEVGRASGLKMCYAGLTKGTFTLHTAVLLAAQSLGLGAELAEEFRFSQPQVYDRMRAVVPRLPADSARWIGEMEEIARTFEAAGVTPAFHQGAAAIFTLLAETPFARETRETMDTGRTLEDAIRVFAEHLGRAPGQTDVR